MAQETKLIPYKEFAKHIEEHLDALDAPGSELTIEKNGRVFHVYGEVTPKKDIWADYSPERMLAVIERRAGNVLKGVDTDKLRRDIKAARGQDTIGRPAD